MSEEARHVLAEVALFMGGKPGDLFSKRDITLKVLDYIRDHNLYKPGRDHIIEPDERLRSLLGPARVPVHPEGDWDNPRYSLINLEIYINGMMINERYKDVPEVFGQDAAGLKKYGAFMAVQRRWRRYFNFVKLNPHHPIGREYSAHVFPFKEAST